MDKTEIAVILGSVLAIIAGGILMFLPPTVVDGEPTQHQPEYPFVVRTIMPEDLDR